MNNLENFDIPSFKKGSGIHIKKKNRGKFTEYCDGKVTQKCIDKAKKSGNKTLVKRATFAENTRKWKHLKGGSLYSAGNVVNTLYENNNVHEKLGTPWHKYDFTLSEEWANAHGYFPDERGHRDDRVKKETHPSHPSRGRWNKPGTKFYLSEKGMQDPNHTLFGLADGGLDPLATLYYKKGIVLPEITVTPNESYVHNTYDNIKLYRKHLQGGLIKKFLNPSDKLEVIKPTNGGYDESSYAKRKRDLHRWTPAAGLYDPFLLIFNNANTGEENEYYKTYLGFESAVPLMTSGSETEWDALIELEKKNNGELPSEFYGTTPRMDHHLQAAADTLNLGRMVRGEMPLIEGLDLDIAKKAYELAKRVMDNPGKWLLMQDYVIQTNPEVHETYENNPLGMLDLYGMKWDPKEGKLFIHDTYNFPKWAHKIGFILERPREMKIRGAIKFDPKKGSLLLRDKNYKWPLLKVLK